MNKIKVLNHNINRRQRAIEGGFSGWAARQKRKFKANLRNDTHKVGKLFKQIRNTPTDSYSATKENSTPNDSKPDIPHRLTLLATTKTETLKWDQNTMNSTKKYLNRNTSFYPIAKFCKECA